MRHIGSYKKRRLSRPCCTSRSAEIVSTCAVKYWQVLGGSWAKCHSLDTLFSRRCRPKTPVPPHPAPHIQQGKAIVWSSLKGSGHAYTWLGNGVPRCYPVTYILLQLLITEVNWVNVPGNALSGPVRTWYGKPSRISGTLLKRARNSFLRTDSATTSLHKLHGVKWWQTIRFLACTVFSLLGCRFAPGMAILGLKRVRPFP